MWTQGQPALLCCVFAVHYGALFHEQIQGLFHHRLRVGELLASCRVLPLSLSRQLLTAFGEILQRAQHRVQALRGRLGGVIHKLLHD